MAQQKPQIMQTVVLGLGNLVHSDDGVGVHAIHGLQRDERVPVAPEAPRSDPAPTPYRETNESTQPDLDKPTFLRRLGF